MEISEEVKRWYAWVRSNTSGFAQGDELAVADVLRDAVAEADKANHLLLQHDGNISDCEAEIDWQVAAHKKLIGEGK